MQKSIGLAAAIVALVFLSSISACSQGTAFTYQGKLTDSSVPANGTYPTRFALYDAATGGNVIAVEYPNITVINGIFTVTLDFGANRFDGNPRYLEINIDGNTLTPRQPINSAPYAIRSSKAAVADNANQLGGVNASQYVQTNDSRMTDARTPTANSPDYIQNRTTQQTTSNFNISGDGAANTFTAATQYNVGLNRVLTVNGLNFTNTFVGVEAGNLNPSGNFNSFLGNGSGKSTTTGGNNSFYGSGSGIANQSGSDNAFFGRNAGFGNTASQNSFFGSFSGAANSSGSSNSFFGSGAGGANLSGSQNTMIGASSNVGANNLTNSTAIGANALVSQSNSIVLGSIKGINGATADTNVGIGTTAPIANLHVTGTQPPLNIFGPGYPAAPVLQVVGAKGGDSWDMILAAGNGASVLIQAGDGGYGANSYPGNGGSITLQPGVTGTGFGSGISGSVILSPTAGTLVGIGTSTPYYKLHVVGTGFFTANLTANGNVGIGTQSPISRLHLNDSSANFAMTFTNSANTAGRRGYRLAFDTDRFSFQRADDAGNFAANQMVIDQASGNVGIGTDAPAQKLDVQGDVRIGTSGTNGCLQNRSGGVIGGTCSSDLRFKRNITPFGSVLSSFSKLRPVNFYWRTDEFADKHFGPERSYGLIAQEVEQVFPDLVSIDEQGYKAVNYSKLPLLTIQAVNEQQTQIENQQKQIEQQRKQIESLTKIVCEIKSTADICRQ